MKIQHNNNAAFNRLLDRKRIANGQFEINLFLNDETGHFFSVKNNSNLWKGVFERQFNDFTNKWDFQFDSYIAFNTNFNISFTGFYAVDALISYLNNICVNQPRR